MVSIAYKTTAGAMMDSIREFFSLSVPTLTTGLSCVSRVNSYQSPIGTFSLIRQVLSKSRPCSIRDTFRKTTIMHHLINRQIFNTDYAILINNFSGFLMTKVITPVRYSFMHFGNSLASFLSFRTSLF